MRRTKYSDDIPGSEGNYHWPVRFDRTTPGGFLGITQHTPTSDDPRRLDRVLLSPRQVKALLDFLTPRRKR